jgi:hypothetical protein
LQARTSETTEIIHKKVEISPFSKDQFSVNLKWKNNKPQIREEGAEMMEGNLGIEYFWIKSKSMVGKY